MKIYTVVDDISGKKVYQFVELDDDETAKRAFAYAMTNKNGPLALVAFKPIDFRLVCVGEVALDGCITACQPFTICRMDDLAEVK